MAEKMKTRNKAGLFAWFLALLSFGLLVLGIWAEWKVSMASYDFAHSPRFRVRILLWFAIQIPMTVVGAIAMTRDFRGRFGKGTDTVRRANLIEQAKGRQ